jgi:2-hydroxymuconate-semialdehyde hydrolase
VRTSVIEIGDGPPLVLLHGAIEVGGVFWAPVLGGLAERHRVVVPDLPGLGESSPVDRLDPDRFAGWFAELLRATDARRPVLVAHSLVGSLAARTAEQWRGTVRRLVIYAAPGVGPYRMPLRLRYLAVRFALRPTAANAERFDRFALHDLGGVRRRDPEWFDAFVAYTLSQAGVPHVKRTMRQLIAAETKAIPDADLDRIVVPTALLWGRHDRMAPLSLAEVASARHGWPLTVIDGAGHAPHVESPERFIDALTKLEAR